MNYDGRVRPLVLAVLGPTASGKSALGLRLAERYDGEIINCDSTAVYRGFDIGTDKLPVEQRRGIPHHLIDILDPDLLNYPFAFMSGVPAIQMNEEEIAALRR